MKVLELNKNLEIWLEQPKEGSPVYVMARKKGTQIAFYLLEIDIFGTIHRIGGLSNRLELDLDSQGRIKEKGNFYE